MRNRIRSAAVAAGRGVVLAGWSMVGMGALVALVGALGLLPLVIGVYLTPPAVAAVRGCADRARRWAGRWSGVPVARPYRQRPPFGTGFAERWRHTAWLLADPATRRDGYWLVLNPIVGLTLASVPAVLLLHALWSLVYPFVWRSLGEDGDWYLVFPVSSTVAAAVVALPFALLSAVAAGWAGPRLLRLHGRFTAWLLASAPGEQLAARVRHLTETLSEAVDAQAAELRRIERDLHDGAQARLVAMGMTLSAAGGCWRRTRRRPATCWRRPVRARPRR